MAKREGQNTDKPSKRTPPPKNRRGFWATLFEPVAQDPDADYLFEEYIDDDDSAETAALLHELLHGDEDEATAANDAVERITWEDGAPVVTDIPSDDAYGGEFSAAQDEHVATGDDAYSILAGSFADDASEDEPVEAHDVPPDEATAETIEATLDETLAETPATIELVAESVVVEEPPQSAYTPPAFFYATPTPDADADTPPGYVPLTSTIDAAGQAAPEAPAEPPVDDTKSPDAIGADTTMVPYVPSAGGYTPLSSAIDAGTQITPYTPPVSDAPVAATGYVPLTSAMDAETQPVPYAPPPPAISYATPAVPDANAVAQAEWRDYAGGASAPAQEPIQLFDDDLSDTARQCGQTTRLFRTGTSATTRIHINETEEAVRREEAARRAEAREAKRRQDASMARRGKRKKRGAILRSLFANIAFVLFFIAVVVVALYYGFLLSDIVVMGNEKYTSDDIIARSGLTLGTHMLFCNLDDAAAKIGEDPFIQVDSVTYIFPNRVRIIVSERKEVAGISGLDYNVIIDDQGYVLSMSPGTDLSGLLQVSGVSMTGFRLGQKLGEGNDFSTATLIELIGKLEQYELMDDIAAIDLTTPLAITMKAKNNLTIHVGQGTDLDSKMSMLSRLLPRFFEQSIGSGTLYLSAKGGAVYSPPYAASNAQPIATDDPNADIPIANPDFIDDDGDGLDDVTGLPAGQTATPAPGTTSTPTPAPTAYVPGGGADDFSG